MNQGKPRMFLRMASAILFESDGWLEVEGIQKVKFTSGTFVMEDGKRETGNGVQIYIKKEKFDDGQSAIDIALDRRGKLTARFWNGKNTFVEGEILPFKVQAHKGPFYTVWCRGISLQRKGWNDV